MAQTRQTPLTCSGHTRPVVDLSFSPITTEGIFLISACKDGNPMLRNGQTGDWIGTLFGHKGAVWSATCNATATKAATASADFTAKLWDIRTGDEITTFSHSHVVRTAALSKDETKLFTGGQEKKLRIFDVERPKDPLVIEAHTGTIKSLILEEEQQNLFFSSGDEKEIRVWDKRMCQQVLTCGLESPVTSMELTLNQKYLISTSGRKITFWDLASFSKVKEFSTTFDVDSASLHPDGTRFIAGGSDFYIHVYSFDDGKELEVHKGHHGPVHCIRYSPDGELYASGSEDGTIRLWQTRPGTAYGLWQGISNGKEDAAPSEEAGTS